VNRLILDHEDAAPAAGVKSNRSMTSRSVSSDFLDYEKPLVLRSSGPGNASNDRGLVEALWAAEGAKDKDAAREIKGSLHAAGVQVQDQPLAVWRLVGFDVNKQLSW
jgi:hypothetical protein